VPRIDRAKQTYSPYRFTEKNMVKKMPKIKKRGRRGRAIGVARFGVAENRL
jgi:hypothetical protein